MDIQKIKNKWENANDWDYDPLYELLDFACDHVRESSVGEFPDEIDTELIINAKSEILYLVNYIEKLEKKTDPPF